MNELALFAGAGGGLLASAILGWKTICAVEKDIYAAGVLIKKQNEGAIKAFPIWDDVRSFEGKLFKGCIDVVSAGFPCQDISIAGTGEGIEGESSSLFFEVIRIVREVGPRFIFLENSPILTTRGLDRVLGSLAEIGFNAEWTVLGADDVGANHIRKRIWILAYSDREWELQPKRSFEEFGRWSSNSSDGSSNSNTKHDDSAGHDTSEVFRKLQEETKILRDIADTDQKRLEIGQRRKGKKLSYATEESWWSVEPSVGRVVNGLAGRVDRIKCLGNGQVPLCAATAWKILYDRIAK